jgi:hypothetical protein
MLGNLGTIKALSLQPYLSAVNKFYKDHGREPVALGNFVARVRKGLAASHVSLSPTLIRAPLPAKIVQLVLVRAEIVRLNIQQLGTRDVPRTKIELLRACVASTISFPLFSGGGAGIECLIGDLVTTEQGDSSCTIPRNMRPE